MMAIVEKVTDMNLRDLDPLSKQLSGVSDELNAALETIQQKINAKHLGVEVFLSIALRESSELLSEDAEDIGLRRVTSEHLGYGKDDDGNWGLIVGTYEGREKLDRDDEWEEIDGGYVSHRSLLRASRAIRAQSIEHIPSLLDALHAEAQRLIDKVARAKAIATSLDDE